MHVTLDDETAKIAADLRLKLSDVIAKELVTYFGEPAKINWGATVVSLMMVAADTNKTVDLDPNEAMQFFYAFSQGYHSSTNNTEPSSMSS
jgi:hypothetical protein